MHAEHFEKVAVITGSTGGIGEGIARRLAQDGIKVVISGRRKEHGEQVASDIVDNGGRAIYLRTDIANPKDCIELIHSAADNFGRLDILINNAAVFPEVSLEDNTPELWDDVMAVNVRGAFLCCQQAIPVMRRQEQGSIINIGSTLNYRCPINRLAYACSKGALLTMTKGLARALLKDRIRVNWVTVGWVATPGEIALRDTTVGKGMKYLQEQGNAAPLGRLETVEDISEGVAFLVSDNAEHITGCELNISGGLWI